jgi:hypothetical protein
MPGCYAILSSDLPTKRIRVATLSPNQQLDPSAAKFLAESFRREGEELVEVIHHECHDQNHLLEYMFEAGRRYQQLTLDNELGA